MIILLYSVGGSLGSNTFVFISFFGYVYNKAGGKKQVKKIKAAKVTGLASLL